MGHNTESSKRPRDRNPDIAFGKLVKRYRRERKLTQEQLSWATGMSRVYISEIERGLREPSLGTILKLSRSLGVSAGAFVNEVVRDLPDPAR